MLAVLAALSRSADAEAQDLHAPVAADAGAASGDARTLAVRALSAGQLDVDTEPQALFDVELSDEPAVQVERARVQALLSALPDASVYPERFAARAELDRARLAFYTLPAEERAELLQKHAAKRAQARPVESEADRVAKQADEERERALRAAQEARSEAERVVAEERVRVMAVQHAVAKLQQRFAEQRIALRARVENVLGWQRRLRDVKRGSAEAADSSYDALRVALRGSREELAQALEQLNDERSEVPALGADVLERMPPDVGTSELRARRSEVERQRAEAHGAERELREERASTLLDEVDALNRERLGLLPHLTADKRGALTGFTATGWDQARAEARQLLQILSFHRYVALRFVERVRTRDGIEGWSVLRTVAASVPWLLALLTLAWWRRRVPGLLALAVKRAALQDRLERRTEPSRTLQALRFVAGIQRPLSWLCFFWLSVWLLPEGASALLEVQLMTVVIGWSLSASLIVNMINALATLTDTRTAEDSNQLRLRSLRLVGRVVVAFALVLLLSARLVGEGTAFQWVLRTCWFAALPVFLVLVRWWRETVFVRLARVRRKSPLQQWILDHRLGWKSFFAAMIAAVQLFVAGAIKTLGGWLSRFTLTRRADAYLFKRELDRLASERKADGARKLDADAHAALAPDHAGSSWVSCAADDVFQALSKRLASGTGGIVAVVGARGMGKSTLLAKLRAQASDAVLVQCAEDSELAVTGHPSLVILDDAHLLIKPVLGGLRKIDELLALARDNEQRGTLWVLALDAVLWPFLRRARDDRPLFDALYTLAPWTDEQIGALLDERSRAAGFEPSFEDLLEKLPRSADEIDRQEALAEKRAGYVRVVWDYAGGNPAIALEVWRSSLVQDAQGAVRARPLQVPPEGILERQPDSMLFILRAVLQMAPASCTDVAQATRISEGQVQDAFRFGRQQGYLTEEAGRVRVTWPWLRSVQLTLERRHLLVRS